LQIFRWGTTVCMAETEISHSTEYMSRNYYN
jgi:hypothetical protein